MNGKDVFFTESQLSQLDLATNLIDDAARIVAKAMRIRMDIAVETRQANENETEEEFVKIDFLENFPFEEWVSKYMF